MSRSPTIDAARLEIILTELRLPAMKAMWPEIAAEAVWRVNLGETAAAIRMDGRRPIAGAGSSRFVPCASVF